MTDPLVGTNVAHYEVLAKLGGGGMGVVYSARDQRLGRLVALKCLPPQWSHDEGAKQRFLREAQAASATQHRNICTIHDIETDANGRLFIVMAYYEGQTLKQRLESGPLSIEEAVDVAGQIAEGLAKAHSVGVVHRDIKPGNLMMTTDDVKILDFGLAKFANSLQLTIEGSTLGTVAYMSPEQTRGEEADARSDVWAVGVVLYEMLTGTLPFKGAYPEAVSNAIRNEPMLPLKVPGQNLPPELIRVVERTLAKNPSDRYQTAHELLRDLRLLQGRTVPMDVTRPVTPPPINIIRRERWWQSRAALAVAAIVVLAGVGTPLWIFAPAPRVSVIVAPVVNQTGYAELDAYRPALTEELISILSASPVVRVLPYDRELQIMRRFRDGSQDISSREALQALVANGGASLVIAPTLLYENGAWRARLAFQDAATGATTATVETAPAVSSLMKETVYGLIAPLTTAVETQVRQTGPVRARIADALRRASGRSTQAASLRFRTLDAAAALEKGLDAFEQLEYGSALKAFTDAGQQDPRSPLLLAWRSRSAQLMRHDDESSEAAEQAIKLLTDQTPRRDRLFVEAVAAESRRDFEGAETRYRELMREASDEPALVLELASFLDRRGTRNDDAISAYQQALELDTHQARPELELCRMYNRLNEGARAKERGQQALSKYRQIGARAGEAQVLFCLTDALRVGNADQQREAKEDAQAALGIVRDLNQSYNLPRAYNYVALATEAQGNLPAAAALWEQALTAAREAGNRVLEPLVLLDLGVMSDDLGNRARALDFYKQSQARYEALGDQARAAQVQTDVGLILIAFGGAPEEGLRDVQNAAAVFRQLGDKNFEVTAAQYTAEYYRYAGRHADAERELNRAVALSREGDLDYEIASALLIQAKSRFDIADYAAARGLLIEALPKAQRDARNARILLARSLLRLGDRAAAGEQLAMVASEVRSANDPGPLPALRLAMGEVAYESGRVAEARDWFAQASALWVDDLPDPASVEARAYLGLIDSAAGRQPGGRTLLTAALAQAVKLRYLALTAKCRVYLARLEVGERRFDAALGMLDQIPPDDQARTIGNELRAQERYWRGRALSGKGDSAAAAQQQIAAQTLLGSLTASVPDNYRQRFLDRPDIRVMNR